MAKKRRSTESQTLSLLNPSLEGIGNHRPPPPLTVQTISLRLRPRAPTQNQSSHIFCSWTLPSRPLVYISTVQLSDVNYTSKRDLTLITTGLKECVVHLSEVAQWNSNQEIMQLASAEHEQSQHYITPNQNTDHVYTTTMPQ